MRITNLNSRKRRLLIEDWRKTIENLIDHRMRQDILEIEIGVEIESGVGIKIESGVEIEIEMESGVEIESEVGIEMESGVEIDIEGQKGTDTVVEPEVTDSSMKVETNMTKTGDDQVIYCPESIDAAGFHTPASYSITISQIIIHTKKWPQ